MKHILPTLGILAAALLLLVLCFFSPSLVERQMENRTNDVQTFPASPVSVPVAEDETVNALGMLSGRYRLLSTNQFGDGTVYTHDRAAAHARELLLDFTLAAGLPATQEALAVDLLTETEGRVFFHLFEKDGLPHSALIWSFRFRMENGDAEISLLFDDATGSLLEIALPLFDQGAAGGFQETKPDAGAWYFCLQAAEAYAKLCGLNADSLSTEPVQFTPDKKKAVSKMSLDFSFSVSSPDGSFVPVAGLWTVSANRGAVSQYLILSPNRDSLSPIPNSAEDG